MVIITTVSYPRRLWNKNLYLKQDILASKLIRTLPL